MPRNVNSSSIAEARDRRSYQSSSYPPISDDTDSMANGAEHVGKMFPQVCAALVACIGAFVMGTGIGWSAPALHQLQDNSTSTFPVTKTDASWIGSLMPAGALFGSFMGGWLSDRFSRKFVMYTAAVHFTAGYALLIGAVNAVMLCLGRLVVGWGAGLVTTSCPTYIAEIASPKVRGILGSAFQLAVTIGVLWTSVIGAVVSWRWLSVSCLVFVVLWVLLMTFLPNSPTYLLTKQQYDAAREALKKLRGTDRVEAELTECQNSVQESIRGGSGGTFKDLGRSDVLRPLLVSVFLMFGQQFSGVNAVIFNAVEIFSSAGSNINEYVENILLNVTQVVITGVSTLIMDKAGRKVLLISSASTMCLTISGLGAFFYLKVHDPATAAHITFLPIICLCIFIAAFSLGYGGIPWLMMSELMAPEMKSISNSIASGANWIMAFIVTRFYADAANNLGRDSTFWAFGVFSLIQVVGVATFVPETKGRTLDEIQQAFRRGGRSSDQPDGVFAVPPSGGPLDDTDLIIDNEEVYPAAADEEEDEEAATFTNKAVNA